VRAALAVRVAQSDKEFQWAKHGVACISRVIIKSSGDYYTATQRVLSDSPCHRQKNAPLLAGLLNIKEPGRNPGVNRQVTPRHSTGSITLIN